MVAPLGVSDDAQKRTCRAGYPKASVHNDHRMDDLQEANVRKERLKSHWMAPYPTAAPTWVYRFVFDEAHKLSYGAYRLSEYVHSDHRMDHLQETNVGKKD